MSRSSLRTCWSESRLTSFICCFSHMVNLPSVDLGDSEDMMINPKRANFPDFDIEIVLLQFRRELRIGTIYFSLRHPTLLGSPRFTRRTIDITFWKVDLAEVVLSYVVYQFFYSSKFVCSGPCSHPISLWGFRESAIDAKTVFGKVFSRIPERGLAKVHEPAMHTSHSPYTGNRKTVFQVTVIQLYE